MNKIKVLLTPKSIAIALVVILITVYAVYFYSDSRVTWAMYKAPLSEIQMINDEGETIVLEVKFVDSPTLRDENLYKGVGINTIQKYNVYHAHSRDVTHAINMGKIRAPLDIAFFDEDGKVISIFQTEVGSTRYRPGEVGDRIPYRYVLMTREGFLSENTISEEGAETKLLPDTLKLK